MKYYNPETAWLWCLLFGPFYWLARENYKHFVMSALLVFVTGGLSLIVYPFFANQINLRRYRRDNWHDMNAGGEQDDTGEITYGRDMAPAPTDGKTVWDEPRKQTPAIAYVLAALIALGGWYALTADRPAGQSGLYALIAGGE